MDRIDEFPHKSNIIINAIGDFNILPKFHMGNLPPTTPKLKI
jgi:hypothetical protein